MLRTFKRFQMMMKYNRQTLPWLSRVLQAASETWNHRHDKNDPQPPKWREGF